MRKIILLLFILISFSFQVGKEERIYNIKHGYSFTVDRSIWIEADAAKKNKKIEQDRSLTGKKLNYDYVFGIDDLPETTIPFFIVSIIPTKSNYFESFKKELSTSSQAKVIENQDALKKYAKEIRFGTNALYFDEKKKTITQFIKVNRNDGVNTTNASVMFFKNDCVIQFVFVDLTEDFPLSYFSFEKITNSVVLQK